MLSNAPEAHDVGMPVGTRMALRIGSRYRLIDARANVYPLSSGKERILFMNNFVDMTSSLKL